jgi:hypothetical protein
MNNLSDDDIRTLMNRYEKHKECCKAYMKRRYHDDEEYKSKVKQQARDYYNTHKEQKKEYYQKTKCRSLAIRRWEYAKKVDKCERYISKYSDDFKNYIKPSLFPEDNISQDDIDETETITDS